MRQINQLIPILGFVIATLLCIYPSQAQNADEGSLPGQAAPVEKPAPTESKLPGRRDEQLPSESMLPATEKAAIDQNTQADLPTESELPKSRRIQNPILGQIKNQKSTTARAPSVAVPWKDC